MTFHDFGDGRQEGEACLSSPDMPGGGVTTPPALTPPPTTCTASKHGTVYAHRKFGCTCPEVYRFRKAYRMRYESGERTWVDATGTKRRVQALMANGWRWADIAPRLGWKPTSNLGALTAQSKVTQATAAIIAQVYDELSMTPGPSEITRRRALRLGYAPPLAWDDDTIDNPDAQPDMGGKVSRFADEHIDEIAVERACSGDRRVQLTKREKREVARRLYALGYGWRDVQERSRLNGVDLHAALPDAVWASQREVS